MIKIALTTLLVLFHGSYAFSQSAEEEAAHTLYESGKRLFSEGKYPEALEKFLGAGELQKNVYIVFYLAITYEALGDCINAMKYFDGLEGKLPEEQEKKRAAGTAKCRPKETVKAQAAVEEKDGEKTARELEASGKTGKTLGYVLTGTGGLALSGAALFFYFYFDAKSGFDANMKGYRSAISAQDAETYRGWAKEQSVKMKRDSIIAFGLLGAGIAACSFGIYYLASGGEEVSAARSIGNPAVPVFSPVLIGDSAGFAVTGGF
ncbi:MAG: hypothetical protein FJ088_01685 [Deltaproteobacteria bacterium]|nr:hypothetical protein [Deltaproteobacteria bacterium]